MRGVNGSVEASFQAALYTAFNQLLPSSTAINGDQIDLIVVKDNQILAGYELKVSKKSALDLDNSIKQAER